MRIMIIICNFFVNSQIFSFENNANHNRIVYYCANKSKNPWDENAILACRGSFYPAVLGLLLYVDNNAELKALSLESFFGIMRMNIIY